MYLQYLFFKTPCCRTLPNIAAARQRLELALAVRLIHVFVEKYQFSESHKRERLQPESELLETQLVFGLVRGEHGQCEVWLLQEGHASHQGPMQARVFRRQARQLLWRPKIAAFDRQRANKPIHFKRFVFRFIRWNRPISKNISFFFLQSRVGRWTKNGYIACFSIN